MKMRDERRKRPARASLARTNPKTAKDGEDEDEDEATNIGTYRRSTPTKGRGLMAATKSPFRARSDRGISPGLSPGLSPGFQPWDGHEVPGAGKKYLAEGIKRDALLTSAMRLCLTLPPDPARLRSK
jgi:hypothetical protein